VRVLGPLFVTLAFATTLLSIAHGQAVDAVQVLAAARQALGGEKNLSAVRTFTATGRTRQVRGNNLVPIEFEINCELPDKFVRRDEFPAQDADPTTLGFSGDVLIQFPPPPPAPGVARGGGPTTPRGGPPAGAPPAQGGRGGPASPDGGGGGGPALTPAQQRLVNVKQDFARLVLGMFAASFPSYPLTFRYAGQGEAPEGKADVIDVAGPAKFSARLVVQRETHLPVMLMWQAPATSVLLRIPGQAMPDTVPPGTVVVDASAPPPSTASQDERAEYAAAIAALRRQALAQARPIEYRMYYGDFRDANGLEWPFRVRRAVAGETVEETTFDRIRINAKIDPRTFEATK
jgi:hypothetical protein